MTSNFINVPVTASESMMHMAEQVMVQTTPTTITNNPLTVDLLLERTMKEIVPLGGTIPPPRVKRGHPVEPDFQVGSSKQDEPNHVVVPESQSEAQEQMEGSEFMDLSLILASDLFRCRPAEDKATLESYTENFTAYKMAKDSGETIKYPFAPIWIWWDDEQWHLVTGFHRYKAAQQANMDKILVKKFIGSKDEAMMFAMKDNNSHGLRMRHNDWKYCIGKALRLYPDKTTGAVAKELGCPRSTAYRIESELSQMGQLARADKKRGADGKVRTTQPKSKKPSTSVANTDGDPSSTEQSGQDDTWDNMVMKDKRRFVNGNLNGFVKDLPDKASRLQYAKMVKEWADHKVDVLSK